MNIRSLEHLLAVAETGSFSKAAERCFITQSALSRSIQTLETDLGGQLLASRRLFVMIMVDRSVDLVFRLHGGVDPEQPSAIGNALQGKF